MRLVQVLPLSRLMRNLKLVIRLEVVPLQVKVIVEPLVTEDGVLEMDRHWRMMVGVGVKEGLGVGVEVGLMVGVGVRVGLVVGVGVVWDGA